VLIRRKLKAAGPGFSKKRGKGGETKKNSVRRGFVFRLQKHLPRDLETGERGTKREKRHYPPPLFGCNWKSYPEAHVDAVHRGQFTGNLNFTRNQENSRKSATGLLAGSRIRGELKGFTRNAGSGGDFGA